MRVQRDIKEARGLAASYLDGVIQQVADIEEAEEALREYTFAYLPTGEDGDKSDAYFEAMVAIVYAYFSENGEADIERDNNATKKEKQKSKKILKQLMHRYLDKKNN